jgi:hypothetical protein
VASNTNATVTLSLVDLTQDRIKSLRTDIEALAKMRTGTAMDAQGRAQGMQLTQQAQALRDAERGWRGVGNEASRATTAVSGFGRVMAGFSRSAIGGAGVGPLGSILTAGSIGAAVAAVGMIAGQSVKMAYEFQKAATTAAAALSVGTGPNLQANISAMQTASAKGLQYNFTRPETLAAITTYAKTSGTGIQAANQAAGGISMYARAYGMDQSQVAAIVGQVTALSGKSFDSEAGGMFGAAEGAGNLGRRLPEFLGAATSMLAEMQASNAEGHYTGGQAASLIANISRGETGYYGTAAGAQSFFGAGKGLIGGMSQGQGRMAFGVAAGMSQLDIALERGGPENERKLMLQAGKYAQLGNGGTEMDLINVLKGQGLDANTIRNSVDKVFTADGKLKGKTWDQAVNAAYTPGAPLSPAAEAALVKKRADEYKNSPQGKLDALTTQAQEKELEAGTKLLSVLEKAQKLFEDHKKAFEIAGAALLGVIAFNSTVTALNTLALVGKGGGGALKWLKGFGKAGAATAEAAGVEGAEAAAGIGGEAAALTGGAEAVGTVGAGVGTGVGLGLAAPLVVGGAVLGAAWTGLYHALGGARMGQASDIGHLASSGLSDDASRSLIMGGSGTSRSLFSSSQSAALNAASKKYGIPVGLIAGLALQEHAGAVSNSDQVNGGGRGWFQIDTGSHMDWLKSHNMGHDFASAADYAASMVADTWKTTHSTAAVGEYYNAGHVGGKTTVNNRGDYEHGLNMAIDQAYADGVGSTTIADGNGGRVSVVVKATHHPAKKLATQSVIKTRA